MSYRTLGRNRRRVAAVVEVVVRTHQAVAADSLALFKVADAADVIRWQKNVADA
jgi:hypothetical protein